MQAGYIYGAHLKELTGGSHRFRAPGLLSSNFELGLLSAVIFVISLLTLTQLSNVVTKRMSIVGMSAGIVGSITSASRTSILFALLGMLIIAIRVSRQSSYSSASSKFAVTFLSFSSVIVAALSANSVLITTATTSSRFVVWRDLLHTGGLFFGNGIGSVGTTTTSKLAITPVFVDNYFLSVLLQFGILGLVLFLICLFQLLKCNEKVRALIAPLLVACIFLEVWEYWIPMTCLLIVVGYKEEISNDF